MTLKTLIAASALAAVAWTGAATAGPNSIKIGVLTDLTSFASSAMGPGSVLATQIAAEDFGNKVNGKPIEVISADMQSKPDLAVQIARRWYEAEGVDVIVDVPASAAAITINGLAAEFNKLSLATVAATPEITGKACTPNDIHWVGNVPQLARGMVDAMAAQGAKNWFLLMPDYQLGKDLAAGATSMINEIGGKVVDTVFYPTNSTDYSQYLLRAQSSGADVIGTGGVGLDLTNQIKQAVEFGILPGSKQKLAAFVMNLSDIHALGPQTMQGIYILQEYYWNQNDETRAFAKKFFAKSQKMPNFTHASDYSATVAYLKAIQETKNEDPKKIVEYLKSKPIDRWGQQTTIRKDGRSLFDVTMYQVKSPAEVKEPWDYLKAIATIPAARSFPGPSPDCPLNK